MMILYWIVVFVHYCVVRAQDVSSLSCLKDALDIYIVLDTSGSIANEFGAFEKQLNWAEKLSQVLLENVQNRVGILAFNERVYPKFELTSSVGEMQKNIEFMSTCRECQPHGRTATHLGVKQANEELQKGTKGSKKVIILLTDGEPYMSSEEFQSTCGYEPDCDKYDCEYFFSATTRSVVAYTKDPTCLILTADNVKNAGVSVYTAGVGSITRNEKFEQLLKQNVASEESWYKRVSEFNDLQGFASELAETLICDATRHPLVDARECQCVCNDGYEDPGDESLPCIKVILPPATEAPTLPPATEAPETETPVTEAPATETPVTEAPVTETPLTETPVTEAPVTEAPVTKVPSPIAVVPAMSPAPSIMDENKKGALQCLKTGLDIYLVIDTSGSIANVFGAYENEIQWAKTIAKELMSTEQNKVGILGFNDRVYPQYELTSDADKVQENIEFMRTCSDCRPNGRTATHLAMKAAFDDLTAIESPSNKVIILLTDGQPYMSNEDFEASCGYTPDCDTYECDFVFSAQLRRPVQYTSDPTCVIRTANEIKSSNVAVYAVGVGKVTKEPKFEDLLQNHIASESTWYQRVTEFDQLEEFSTELTENIICDPTRRPLVEGRFCVCTCNEGFLDPGNDGLPCIKITPAPSLAPTIAPPTIEPTAIPTLAPTLAPTAIPTLAPTLSPTQVPTLAPVQTPTTMPTENPTEVPSTVPTAVPTILSPSTSPSEAPSSVDNSNTDKLPNKDDAFGKYDIDMTGSLDRFEIIALLKDMGIDAIESDLDYLFSTIDKNSGGEIDLLEYQSWLDAEKQAVNFSPLGPFNLASTPNSDSIDITATPVTITPSVDIESPSSDVPAGDITLPTPSSLNTPIATTETPIVSIDSPDSDSGSTPSISVPAISPSTSTPGTETPDSDTPATPSSIDADVPRESPGTTPSVQFPAPAPAGDSPVASEDLPSDSSTPDIITPTITAPSTQGPISSTDTPSTLVPSTEVPALIDSNVDAPSTNTPESPSPSLTTPSTTETPSTLSPTMVTPPTSAPSSETPVAVTPSSSSPSTEAPSTERPSSSSPSAEAPSTEAPSSSSPSTEAPSTETPVTLTPSSSSPSTEAPSTETPVTLTPSSSSPSTEAPSTETPVTLTPSSSSPSTEAPSTETPSSSSPSTEAPSTETPVTPSSSSPSTEAPLTEIPVSASLDIHCEDCAYRFKDTCAPTFSLTLPTPGIYRDHFMNTNPYNPIVMSSGDRIEQACNEYEVDYLNDEGNFVSNFKDKNGNAQSLRNLFYVSYHDTLMQRRIQTPSENIVDILHGKVVRMRITCNNNQRGCLLFKIA